MASNGEKGPESKDKPHPFEEHPKPGPDPDKARKVGEKADQGTTGNKGKK